MSSRMRKMLVVFLVFFVLSNSLAFADTNVTPDQPAPIENEIEMEPEEEDLDNEEASLESNEIKTDEEEINTQRITPVAEEDVVYTADELVQWCENHKATGGKVTLGGNITISDTYHLYSGAHIQVDTGIFGVKFDGGSLYSLDRDNLLEYIGQGTKVPVLTLVSTGFFWGSRIESIQKTNITATGKAGEKGATAVRIEEVDSYAPTLPNYESSQIRAYGDEAIGIEIVPAIEVRGLDVAVNGKNSVAVKGPKRSTVKFSRLSATGVGSAVTKSSGLEINTCKLNAMPSKDIKVLDRKILSSNGNRMYMPTPLNEQIGWNIDNSPTYQFLVLIGDRTLALQDFQLELNQTVVRSIDTSTPGVTSVPCDFMSYILRDLGMIDKYQPSVDLDVRDTELPCIERFEVTEDFDGRTVLTISSWMESKWEREDLFLEKSEDGGKSWIDITNDENVETYYYNDDFDYIYSEISKEIMFRLKAIDGTISNAMTLYPDDKPTEPFTGGDRNGVERIIGVKTGTGRPSPENPEKPKPGEGNKPGSGNPSSEIDKERIPQEWIPPFGEIYNTLIIKSALAAGPDGALNGVAKNTVTDGKNYSSKGGETISSAEEKSPSRLNIFIAIGLAVILLLGTMIWVKKRRLKN